MLQRIKIRLEEEIEKLLKKEDLSYQDFQILDSYYTKLEYQARTEDMDKHYNKILESLALVMKPPR